MLKGSENGRVVGVDTLIATRVTPRATGRSSAWESAPGWDGLAGVLPLLVARDLSGVGLVTSDAHAGLVAAIGAN